MDKKATYYKIFRNIVNMIFYTYVTLNIVLFCECIAFSFIPFPAADGSNYEFLAMLRVTFNDILINPMMLIVNKFRIVTLISVAAVSLCNLDRVEQFNRFILFEAIYMAAISSLSHSAYISVQVHLNNLMLVKSSLLIITFLAWAFIYLLKLFKCEYLKDKQLSEG